MVDGVDRKGRMAARNGGDKKTPDEQLRAVGVEVRLIHGKEMSDEQDYGGFHNGDRVGDVFEKDQFRVLEPILRVFYPYFFILRSQYPSDMAPEKTLYPGRMKVLVRVRVDVVMTMNCGPP